MAVEAIDKREFDLAGSGPSDRTVAAPKKLIVIVPAYNEEAMISDTVAALKEEADRLTSHAIEMKVYVVNDGSHDRTAELARAAGADRIVHHRVNLGLGAAVRSGLAAARADGADILVKFDADFQHAPKDIQRIIQPILDDIADVVYGNRFERIEYTMPPVRRLGNLVFTGLMRRLTGWDVRDSQPGIFAVSRAYLQEFYVPGDYNYTQQIMLDAYHKGMRFTQVPVTFKKRTTGKSFISFKYPLKVLPQIIMVLVGVKPLRVFGPIGLMCVVLAMSIFATQFVMWLFEATAKPVENVNLVLGLFIFGMQTLFFGILADLIVRKTQSGSLSRGAFRE